jgi:N-acetylmuramoyl-L-alanine amidase
MIFISAGHHLKDSGAVNTALGIQENTQAIRLRDKIVSYLKLKGRKFITDKDTETLKEYLDRIDTGDGSVVLEIHFDASGTGKAEGCTAFVSNTPSKYSQTMGAELCNNLFKIAGIKNRGVHKESESHRGRLGLMRESGIVVLFEGFFIDNPEDYGKFNPNIDLIAESIGATLVKYEDLIK